MGYQTATFGTTMQPMAQVILLNGIIGPGAQKLPIETATNLSSELPKPNIELRLLISTF
jgi:hypothetical protein